MESNPLRCTLTDSELSEKAQYWIDSLVKSGGKAFVMHVPARPNEDPDLIFAELDQRFLAKCFELASLKAQPGAVWVKAKPANNGFYAVKYTGDGYGGCGFKDGKWNQSLADNKIVAYLDESGTAANQLPTFWDVAEAFKWAAEYSNELGEELVLTEDGQWLLLKEEDGVTTTDELTSGNVAELYCLQKGFNKEVDQSAAGREDAVEEGAIAFADWGNNNVKGFDPMSEKWVYGKDEKRYTTAELYTIFKQQKEK